MAEEQLRMLAAAAVLVPLTAGLVVLILPGTPLPRLRDLAALAGAAATLCCAAGLLRGGASGPLTVIEFPAPGLSGLEAVLPARLDAGLDRLSLLVLLSAAAAVLLVLLWAWGGVRQDARRGEFLAFSLWALAGTALAVLANSLPAMLVGWGVAGACCGLLVTLGGDRARHGAGRTMATLAVGDLALLLGAALLLTADGAGSGRLSDLSRGGGLSLAGPSGAKLSAALLLIVAGALARMGAVPFHGWMPRAAEGAPPAAMAVAPAALNALLGAYLLARMGLFVFDLGGAPGIRALLVAVGAVTAVLGAISAAGQRDLRRLLACLLSAQAGCTVAGLAGGTAAAAGGALLHVLATTAGMGLLFLGLGAVERLAGTSDMARLGGLGRRMPATLAAMLVGSLSVAGVPLLAGFMSRWMICAGLLEGGFAAPAGSPFAKIFTAVALLATAGIVLSSVLTLAVLLRMLHAVFMGRSGADVTNARAESAAMRVSMHCLTLLCLALGICPHWLVHNPFLVRIVAEAGAGGAGLPATATGFALPGGAFWSPLATAGLALAGLIGLGTLAALCGWARARTVRPPAPEGGFRPEELGAARPAPAPETDGFGSSGALGAAGADRVPLDPAGWLGPAAERLAGALGLAHDGVPATQLAWVVLGLVVVVAALLLPALLAA